jgi:hypothetical protein
LNARGNWGFSFSFFQVGRSWQKRRTRDEGGEATRTDGSAPPTRTGERKGPPVSGSVAGRCRTGQGSGWIGLVWCGVRFGSGGRPGSDVHAKDRFRLRMLLVWAILTCRSLGERRFQSPRRVQGCQPYHWILLMSMLEQRDCF